jgi:hypothetical protein
MNNRPVGGSSSETQFHLTEMIIISIYTSTPSHRNFLTRCLTKYRDKIIFDNVVLLGFDAV